MYNQHQAALLELQQSNMHTQIDLKALSQPTDQVLQHAFMHAWVHAYCFNCSFVLMVDTKSATLSCLLPCSVLELLLSGHRSARCSTEISGTL